MKKEKIEDIARKFDQMHVILRLLDAYDSNEFQRLIYPLFPMVREKGIGEATGAFEKQLIAALVSAGVITEGQHTTAGELFTYERFKGMSNKSLNFRSTSSCELTGIWPRCWTNPPLRL